MPDTLLQMAKLTRDPMKKGIMLQILREAPILELLPFENVDALESVAIRVNSLPSIGWRKYGGNYSDGSLGDTEEVAESIFIMGDDIQFDRLAKKVKNWITDPMAFQIALKTRAAALDFNYYFIHGSPAIEADAFYGLQWRVSNMPARCRVRFAGTGGVTAPLDPTADTAGARKFMDTIDKALFRCNGNKGSALLMNEGVLLGFSSVLRFAQFSGNLMDATKDSFDRRILTYMGVPLVDMGLKSDHTTEIITDTEVADDAGADSTSVYVPSFGMDDEGLSGIQLDELEAYDPLEGAESPTAPANLLRFEWAVGLANFGNYSIIRASNLEAPGDWT